MENATKALLMAAGVLIGILILSLAVYLFVDFGGTAAQIQDQTAQQQLVEYNTQFTKYSDDVTIYDIVSLIHLVQANNKQYEGQEEYQITVETKNPTLSEKSTEEQLLGAIKTQVSSVTSSNPLTTYRATEVTYHSGGRVAKMVFAKK